jgi:hypothetical protein
MTERKTPLCPMLMLGAMAADPEASPNDSKPSWHGWMACIGSRCAWWRDDHRIHGLGRCGKTPNGQEFPDPATTEEA